MRSKMVADNPKPEIFHGITAAVSLFKISGQKNRESFKGYQE